MLPEVVQIEAVEEAGVLKLGEVEAQGLPIRRLEAVYIVECEVGRGIELLPLSSLEVDQVKNSALLRLPVEHYMICSAKESGLHRNCIHHICEIQRPVLLLQTRSQRWLVPSEQGTEGCGAPASRKTLWGPLCRCEAPAQALLLKSRCFISDDSAG